MKYNYSQEEIDKKKKEVLDRVTKLNDEYNALLPSLDNTNENGFSLLKKDVTSDAVLKKHAEDQANLEYEQKKAKAQTDTKEKSETLSEAIEAILESSKAKKQETSDNFDMSKKRVEEDASKRGIARSSIANGAVGELEGQKLEEFSKIDEQAAKKSEEIQSQIAELQEKLSELIKTYEQEKVVSATAKFNEAKSERDKKNIAADKYNNSIKKFEVENSKKFWHKPWYTNEAEEAKLEFDKKKVAAVVDFYKSFEDKNKALEDFLSNDELRQALGSSYDMCLRLIYQG